MEMEILQMMKTLNEVKINKNYKKVFKNLA